MKVRLLRDAKIRHHAGEIVEVSPDDLHFLLSLHIAEVLTEGAEQPTPKKKTTKKKEQ